MIKSRMYDTTENGWEIQVWSFCRFKHSAILSTRTYSTQEEARCDVHLVAAACIESNTKLQWHYEELFQYPSCFT